MNPFTIVVLKHSVFIFGKRHSALHYFYIVSFLSGIIRLGGGGGGGGH